jgi:DNA-binding response OmpR family regulator
MKNKVLVLDDESNIRDIFTLLLQENNYLVETAASGREGLEKAKAFAPDVLLLDMNLPDMAGMEVLSRIQRYLPKCRILIITAFGTIRSESLGFLQAFPAAGRGFYEVVILLEQESENVPDVAFVVENKDLIFHG